MDNDARVVKEVLEEHPSLMRKMEGIYLLVLVSAKGESAKDKLETLKAIVDAYARYYVFIEEIKVHETKEETFLLPMLKENELRKRIKEGYRRMEEILEEGKEALEGFRKGEISITKLREDMNALYKEAIDILEEHRHIEESAFKNMTSGKLVSV